MISYLFRNIMRVGLLACGGALFASAQDSRPAPDSQPESRPAESQPASRESDIRPARGERRSGRGRRDGAASAPGAATSASSSSTSTSSTSSSTSSSTASSKAAEKKDRFLAVTGGRVHTVTGPVLDGATILCKNSCIIEIGRDVVLPQECEVIDAAGRYVYPGLVACNAMGLHGTPPIAENTDVYSLTMNLAVSVGITTALTGNEIGKMTFGSVDELLVARNAFFNLNYSSRNPLEKRKLRAEFERVRGYLRDVERHEIAKQTDKDAKPPEKDWLKGRYEDLRKLLVGETTAIASAGAADELLDWVDLVERYGFNLVLRGAYEGWIVAEHLGRAGISVIVTPRTDIDPDPRRNRATGATIENAALLHQAGVRVAVMPPGPVISLVGLAGRDLLQLNMEAAFAVRGGLSNEDALKAITIDAARILGVDSRVGSLEVGKDADIIVADGDLLHYMTMVHETIVNGRLVYEKSKDPLFSHIRPSGKPENADFDDVWPRRLEWREPTSQPASKPTSSPASGPSSQPTSDKSGRAT